MKRLPLFLLSGAFALGIWLAACKNKSLAENETDKVPGQPSVALVVLPKTELTQAKIPVSQAVTIGGFFKFLDEIVRQNDTLATHKLTENLLLRANAWILDTLVRSDYYFQMSHGNFVYDQRKMVVLKPGDTLQIPGPKTAAALLKKMSETRLDINIPAFELRILEGDSLLRRVPVRVGKNEKKYLKMAGHTVDLRTRTGTGEIVRVNREPVFFDPVTGEKFKYTKRDDRRTTLMPQIPWLEPSINGRRFGQMIHPTTNPRTLGKAASNGCIGTSEADGWWVYFFAPVGTKVTIRYDLEEVNAKGDTLRYDDVYRLRKVGKPAAAVAVADFIGHELPGVCLCGDFF